MDQQVRRHGPTTHRQFVCSTHTRGRYAVSNEHKLAEIFQYLPLCYVKTNFAGTVHLLITDDGAVLNRAVLVKPVLKSGDKDGYVRQLVVVVVVALREREGKIVWLI